MTSFIHEEDLGNKITEDGEDVAVLENDSHLFPVENLTDYDQYRNMKPHERMAAAK